MLIRTCRVCRVEKPLNEFTKNRSKSLGHDYECLCCHRASSRLHEAAGSFVVVRGMSQEGT
jgi:hypothetical protein